MLEEGTRYKARGSASVPKLMHNFLPNRLKNYSLCNCFMLYNFRDCRLGPGYSWWHCSDAGEQRKGTRKGKTADELSTETTLEVS
ncbi:hypothetical protein I79_001056 [Cricetulus griseus]|uniref:Uncharacterized protein n=1 Tax=Cricetulus griseus TaxID=10029 RepID=G3GTR8_CRIGR|nr:hypothetical protein I79_001056 [Cricetulus griseus]